MSRLRNSVVILLIYIVGAFVLSGYALQSGDSVGSVKLGAWLGIIAVLSIILFETRWNAAPLLLGASWVGIYFILGLLNVDILKDVSNLDSLPLIILEVLIISVGVAVAYNFINALNEATGLLQETMRLDAVIPIGGVEKAQEHLNLEIYRSRRFKHPLSVVVMQSKRQEDAEVAMEGIVKEIQLSLKDQYNQAGLARATKDLLRQTDFLFSSDTSDRLILVSPYTDVDAAGLLVNRIAQEVEAQLGYRPDFGSATFPDDAIASDELIGLAHERLGENGASILPVDEKH